VLMREFTSLSSGKDRSAASLKDFFLPHHVDFVVRTGRADKMAFQDVPLDTESPPLPFPISSPPAVPLCCRLRMRRCPGEAFFYADGPDGVLSPFSHRRFFFFGTPFDPFAPTRSPRPGVGVTFLPFWYNGPSKAFFVSFFQIKDSCRFSPK